MTQLPSVTEIPLVGEQCLPQPFRLTMGAFPSAVSVVTALDPDGLPRGLTCSATCSLSMAPPAMLICVNRANKSLDAIRHSGGFVVNLLREGRRSVSDAFASSSPHKFADVRWTRSPASGLPLLSGDALAYVDCRVVAELTAGSHVIVVGMVRESAAMPSAEGPLIYWKRTYGSWAALDTEEGGSISGPSHSRGHGMTNTEISARLLEYIRDTFLSGDAKNELSDSSPLLEWGVLNSMNTAMLLVFIRDELNVPVSPMEINAQNFKDINHVTAMIRGLMAVATT